MQTPWAGPPWKKIAFQQILIRAGVVWQFKVVFKIESVCGIFCKLKRILAKADQKKWKCLWSRMQILTQNLFKKCNFRAWNVVVDSIFPLKKWFGLSNTGEIVKICLKMYLYCNFFIVLSWNIEEFGDVWSLFFWVQSCSLIPQKTKSRVNRTHLVKILKLYQLVDQEEASKSS